MALVGVKQLSLSFPIFGCSSNPRMPAISPNNFPSSSSTYYPFQFQNIQVLKSRNPKWFTSRIHCSANSGPITQKNAIVKERSVSVILLAGGKGKRMGADMPKQYLPLLGQPIALYSLYTFSQMVEVKEIVVVCDPSYKDIFEDTKDKIHVDLRFTEPGKERQDSVYNGLQAIDSDAELVCIHDSARPLVYSQDVEKVLKDGWLHGAAVLGVPVKATIKEASNKSFVVKTLDRKTLWEMQTPQVIKPALLKEGFDLVNRKRKEVQGAPENDSSNELAINDIAYDIFSENADDVSIVEHLGHRVKGLEVTDDVSIVEHLGHPVFITEGSYTNIKITTPDDLLLAERILNPRPSS